ncbi:MAG TPA: aminoacyl-histidine dipeptidase [Verrucomicrobiales bacterium]|jgi:dipeptidase D|nr:aminoacyl-histidine dipeptidase [Verrucomicrobiales bacterium]
MQTPVDNLEPSQLWKFFGQLSQIPRESKKEDKAVEWLVQTGRALGCEVETQPIGSADRPFFANVLLRKQATAGREDRPVTVMQAHIDMVCEKNADCPHDFSKDPIALRIDGDSVRATDTTLGADNGIGLCSALAIMADETLEHGPLEVIITVDEEAGMSGARFLKPGWLRAQYLLNLDSEEEGEATISCAGAMDSQGTRPLTLIPASRGQVCLALKVRGLAGGHSGLNIGEGRGNANKLMGAVMVQFMEAAALELASVQGGNKRNAIPREATAVFFCDPADVERLRAIAARMQAEGRAALPAVDSGLTISLEPSAAADTVMSAADARAVLDVLTELPNGKQAMSKEVPGLVETSTNLAIVSTSVDAVEISLLSRSSVDAAKYDLAKEIRRVFTGHGFVCEELNDYPGWQPAPECDVVRLVKRAHEEVAGVPLKITAMHAGLECGLIGKVYPEMQMISFGPNMWGVHTPQEHVSISSVANFWKLLRGVIERV